MKKIGAATTNTTNQHEYNHLETQSSSISIKNNKKHTTLTELHTTLTDLQRRLTEERRQKTEERRQLI